MNSIKTVSEATWMHDRNTTRVADEFHEIVVVLDRELERTIIALLAITEGQESAASSQMDSDAQMAAQLQAEMKSVAERNTEDCCSGKVAHSWFGALSQWHGWSQQLA